MFSHIVDLGLHHVMNAGKEKKEMISEFMTLTHSKLNKTNAALHIQQIYYLRA